MTLELIFSSMSGLAVVGWLALALAPLRRERMIATARAIAALLALAYVILLASGKLGGGASDGGGFGSLAQVVTLLSPPGAMLVAWIHFLAFDLWVGTWQVEDAPKAGVPHWLLLPILLLTFMFGPAGLLAYLVVRLVMSRLKPKAA